MLLNRLKRKINFRDEIPILPGSFPVFGHLPAVVYDSPNFFSYAKEIANDFFWVNFGPRKMLACYHLESFKLLMNKNTNMDTWSSMGPSIKHTMGGQEGEHHRNTRSFAQPWFKPSVVTVPGTVI